MSYQTSLPPDRVEIVEGDALETLPRLEDPFDLLFVDAGKGEYAR